MNWVQKASCKNDKNYSKWLSYDLVDIDYAKKICSSCPVKKQCMIAFFNSTIVGVRLKTVFFLFKLLGFKSEIFILSTSKS